ncbi:MAG: hypothetical protein KH972_07320 [Peptostreptococcaceae bacterium]|nr:hypothetical protein [Peptostreptococcaceae bacterium]
MRNFIREKKIYCGENYLEVDIYPLCEFQLEKKKNKRSKKEKVSITAQKNLNDKNARRKFIQVAETNFTEKDLSVTLTYDEENLPSSIEEAEREVQNYIKRIKRRRKKEGLEDLKYMLVTSSREIIENGEEKPVRIHHHILMNGGLDRDIVEDLWRRRKRKGEKAGKKIGYANADRIQPNSNTGIVALCTYLVGNPTQKRRWTCSQNLTRPTQRTNDYKYSRKRVIQYATHNPDFSIWEKLYPGYYIADKDNGYEPVYNDYTGWSIYLKLRKRT